MGQLAWPLMVASTVLQGVGAHEEGKGQQRALNYQAAQLNQQAGQTRASAQREAIEQRRQAALANSRLQALAGGGGTDAGVVNIASNIAGEGEYRALASLYEGEERAIGMDMAATGKRFEGKQAKRAGNMKAISSLLSNGSSLAYKYGG